MRMNARSAMALLAVAALAACTDNTPSGPLTPDAGPPVRNEEELTPPADGDLWPGEKEFVQLSEQISGFAGYWYEGGERVVALTDPSQQENARAVMDKVVPRPEAAGREEGKGDGSTRFVQAQYDYKTLRAWRDGAVDAAFEQDDATFLDLDEVRNRITVGLLSEDAQRSVSERLAKAGVPLEAVNFEVSGPVEMEQTLQNFFRPLMGGYQIQNPGGGTCTLGFITTNPVNGAPAFVTNSHCTNTYWGFDGVAFGQAQWWQGVGNEVRDPNGFRCFLWGRCRFADAALVQANVNTAINQVARTTWWGTPGNPGSLTVANPPLQVVSHVWWPSWGQMVDKVGRTTGWNYGFVRNTCVLVNVSFNRRLLCQYYADYWSQGGDSGSPVFIWWGDRVGLTGLHWGSFKFLWVRRTIFSPLGGVRLDLGVP
jgi:hypothetical protein